MKGIKNNSLSDLEVNALARTEASTFPSKGCDASANLAYATSTTSFETLLAQPESRDERVLYRTSPSAMVGSKKILAASMKVSDKGPVVPMRNGIPQVSTNGEPIKPAGNFSALVSKKTTPNDSLGAKSSMRMSSHPQPIPPASLTRVKLIKGAPPAGAKMVLKPSTLENSKTLFPSLATKAEARLILSKVAPTSKLSSRPPHLVETPGSVSPPASATTVPAGMKLVKTPSASSFQNFASTKVPVHEMKRPMEQSTTFVGCPAQNLNSSTLPVSLPARSLTPDSVTTSLLALDPASRQIQGVSDCPHTPAVNRVATNVDLPVGAQKVEWSGKLSTDALDDEENTGEVKFEIEGGEEGPLLSSASGRTQRSVRAESQTSKQLGTINSQVHPDEKVCTGLGNMKERLESNPTACYQGDLFLRNRSLPASSEHSSWKFAAESIGSQGELLKGSLAAVPELKKEKHRKRRLAKHRKVASSSNHNFITPHSRQSDSEVDLDHTPRNLDYTERWISREEGEYSKKNDTGANGSCDVQIETLTPLPLTPALRNRIADQFLSILCPQQYYGTVKKLNCIRPLKTKREGMPALQNHNTIFVATKGMIPNSLFYPQLRLQIEDGKPVVEEKNCGSLDTAIIIYEAAPANMIFAETEDEANSLLKLNPHANSCFVLSYSAIIFKEPERYVLPVATLNVRWVPYTSPMSEPQCPIHQKELQLFDPNRKELVCALCVSKKKLKPLNLVVIPDVIPSDARGRVFESISSRLDKTRHYAHVWVEQHQRLRKLKENINEAINERFNVLLTAIASKQRQFNDFCETEYNLAQARIAHKILILDEKAHMLTAASHHLRGDPNKSLYSMQVATIAEGLETSLDTPFLSLEGSFELPNILLPHIDDTMRELSNLTPTSATSKTAIHPNSMFHTRPSDCQDWVGKSSVAPDNLGKLHPSHRSIGLSKGTLPRSARVFHHKSITEASQLSPRPITEPDPSTLYNFDSPLYPRLALRKQHRIGAGAQPLLHGGSSPRNGQPTACASVVKPSQHHIARKGRASSGEAAEKGVGNSPRVYPVGHSLVPNSSGSILFPYPINDLLKAAVDTTSVPRRLREICVQWTLRIEDAGDWVGIGVGVGTALDNWRSGRSNDFSHLWIAPHFVFPSVSYTLRVTVSPTIHHAKLTIHDTSGHQLDDGNIPKWSAARVCYPQITFGGRIGKASMVDPPRVV